MTRTPAEIAVLIDELRSACVGHPNATIAWPHRILHEAADALAPLAGERGEVSSSEAAGREFLLFTSYCGGDDPDCSDAKPCPSCLGMSNVFRCFGRMEYVRELAPEWNTQQPPVREDLRLAPPAPAAMPGVETVGLILSTHTGLQFATDADAQRLKDRLNALFHPMALENERLKAERDRIERNRDMWKGQCDRQAETLRELRMQMLSDEGQQREALAEAKVEAIKQIASVAAAVGRQAGVGASETAGLIVSVLAAHPEQADRFMAEGAELFIDGTMRAENGSLSHLAMDGEIVSPTKLREMKGQSQ